MIVEHPFTDVDAFNSDFMGELEVTFPSFIYGGNARAFVPTAGNPDVLMMYRRMLNLIGYLANMVAAPIRETDSEDPRKSHVVPVTNTATVTYERLPHATTRDEFVGFRLRITEHATETDDGVPPSARMQYHFERLLRRNDDAAIARINAVPGAQRGFGTPQGASTPDLSSIHSLTTPEWNRLRLQYGAFTQVRADQNNRRATNEIGNVFSIRAGLRLAENMHAAAACYNSDIYLHADSQHRAARRDRTSRRRGFANPEHVWSISPSSLMPEQISSLFLPHIVQSKNATRESQNNFARMHGGDEHEGVNRAIFDATMNRTSTNEMRNDIRALTDRMTRDVSQLRSEYASVMTDGLYPEEFYVRLDAIKRDGNSVMASIISPDGDAAPTIRAIASYRDSYLSYNNHTLCIPRARTCPNLTRSEDAWAQQAAIFKTVVTVKSAFKLCIVLLLASLHIYRRVEMNAHHLLLGPPGIGKSFALVLLTRLLIKLTWFMLSTITPKALMVPGKTNDCRIIIFEDSPASLLGVNPANRGGAAVGSSDVENMIKAWLTSMTSSIATVEMEPKRSGVTIEAESSCVCHFALNDPSSLFPAAILARFHVVNSSEQDSSTDQTGLLTTDLMARCSEPAVRAANYAIKVYWHRNQVLCAEIMYRLAAGVLEDISYEGVTIFFGLLAAHMKRTRNINMDDPRKFSRFKSIVTTLVVLDAIDLVWDSKLSPFGPDEKHHIDHFMLVEKHLVALKKHAIFALGLLSNQWEDPVRVAVLATLSAECFPNAAALLAQRESEVTDSEEAKIPAFATIAAPAHMVLPSNTRGVMTAADTILANATGVRAFLAEKASYEMNYATRVNWHSDSCDMPGTVLPLPQASRGQIASKEDRLAALARVVLTKMKQKPLLGEVEAVLRSLTNEMIDETRRISNKMDGPEYVYTETVSVSVLRFDDTAVRMSLTALRHAGQEDSLFRGITEMETALFQNDIEQRDSATYLYGDTEVANPHVWRVIGVKRAAHASDVAPMEEDDDAADAAPAAAPSHFEAERAALAPKVRKPEVFTASTRRYNTGFFDSGLTSFTRSFLQSMRGTNADDQMRDLFSADVPFVNIDMDLDAFATLGRNAALGMTCEEFEASPSGDSRATDLRLWEMDGMEGVENMDYPECFAQRNTVAWERRWTESHRLDPSAFSMSSRYNSMKAAIATRTRTRPVSVKVETQQAILREAHASIQAMDASAATSAQHVRATLINRAQRQTRARRTPARTTLVAALASVTLAPAVRVAPAAPVVAPAAAASAAASHDVVDDMPPLDMPPPSPTTLAREEREEAQWRDLADDTAAEAEMRRAEIEDHDVDQ